METIVKVEGNEMAFPFEIKTDEYGNIGIVGMSAHNLTHLYSLGQYFEEIEGYSLKRVILTFEVSTTIDDIYRLAIVAQKQFPEKFHECQVGQMKDFCIVPLKEEIGKSICLSLVVNQSQKLPVGYKNILNTKHICI